MDKLTSYNCSIGIVTYLGRFETYFKPLIKKLHSLFPDYDINVWINGHYDQARQIQYLKQITGFLGNYRNIRYLTNLDHYPLASGFNRLILMSKCDNILILNDDVRLYFNFRHNFETLESPPEIFTLNGTWCHFVISKNIVKKVGWFDERFLGIGFEDNDYVIRLNLQGIPLGDLKLHGLHDCMAPPEDASWAKISELTWGKYSKINWEFFEKKWGVSDHQGGSEEGEITVWAVGAEWRLKPNAALQVLPELYPLEGLDQAVGRQAGLGTRLSGKVAQGVSWLGSLYWRARLALGAWGRQLLGPRWEQWRGRLQR